MDKRSRRRRSNEVIEASSRNARGNNIKFTKTINYIRGNKKNEKERTRKRVDEKRI